MTKRGRGRLTIAKKALVESLPAQQLVDRVVRVARRFTREQDDVRSVAQEALMLAALRFDPNLGEFIRFAYPRVRGAVIRYVHREWLHQHQRAALTDQRHVTYEPFDGTPEESREATQPLLNAQVVAWQLAQAMQREPAPTPEDLAASAEATAAIVAAWRRLPADYALLVKQAYEDGISLRQLAEHADWRHKSHSALKRMHAAALAQLRVELLKAARPSKPVLAAVAHPP